MKFLETDEGAISASAIVLIEEPVPSEDGTTYWRRVHFWFGDGEPLRAAYALADEANRFIEENNENDD